VSLRGFVMCILSDPVVTALIAEFNDALVQLEHTDGGDSARLAVIEQLCELSRDARFQLGPPEYAESNQLSEMAVCFEQGVNRIRNLWAEQSVPSDVEAYCDNILQRAKRCRMSEPVASH
jgi:hypothetical protein